MATNNDPREYLNDSEETQRLSLDGRQATIWTAMPAIVQSVDFSKMTLTCQIAIKGRMQNPDSTVSSVNISLLHDVPIVFPSAGGFTLTFPIDAGDEVLVVFASRCIDSWWQTGGYENEPMEYRMHDLSDGFAIPGPKSQPKKISAISSTSVQLRNDAGTTYIEIDASGNLNLVGNITMTGNLQVTGNIGATGTIQAHTATAPVGLTTHHHGGVTAGTGNSGGPVG